MSVWFTVANPIKDIDRHTKCTKKRIQREQQWIKRRKKNNTTAAWTIKTNRTAKYRAQCLPAAQSNVHRPTKCAHLVQMLWECIFSVQFLSDLRSILLSALNCGWFTVHNSLAKSTSAQHCFYFFIFFVFFFFFSEHSVFLKFMDRNELSENAHFVSWIVYTTCGAATI